MTVLLVPAAREEFLDAVDYYAEAGALLARRFKEETTRCIHWIAVNHEHFRLRSGGYRRINLKVFPFYLPFVVRGDVLWVLAVAHAARKPEYWIERRPEI
jgi:plasmid stabilization system protein ParE